MPIIKKHLVCNLKIALLFSAIPAVISAYQTFASIPYADSPFLYELQGALIWIGLIVIFGFDAHKRNFGRSISYIVGAAVTYGAILGTMFFGPALNDYVHQMPFDSTVWKKTFDQPISSQNVESDERDNRMYPVRLRMVDDLIKRYRLEGMSRQDIENLIGKPPPTDYFRGYDYVYFLGPERGLIRIDSEWLCIKFQNNVVTEARICRD